MTGSLHLRANGLGGEAAMEGRVEEGVPPSGGIHFSASLSLASARSAASFWSHSPSSSPNPFSPS